MTFFRLPYSSVWLFLVLSSVLGAWITQATFNPMWATSIVLTIASIKVALVMGCFMELGSAPGRWQWPFVFWLVAVTALLVVGFIVS